MTWPKEHIIADEWREAVLVCRCGWRGAERTKTAVRRSWLQHIAYRQHSPLDHMRLDEEPCGAGDWIAPHICKNCGQTFTPVEGHACPTPGISS